MASFRTLLTSSAAVGMLWTLNVQAATSHDFKLTPNAKIQGSCRTNAGNQTSKIKVVVRSSTSLAMSLKACTSSFGFQNIGADIKIPSQLLDVDKMMEIPVGGSVSLGSVRAKRGADSGSKMTFVVTGINPRVASLKITVPTDEGWARAIPGGRRIQLPWSAVSFQYRHAIAGTFDFNGRLNEIQSD